MPQGNTIDVRAFIDERPISRYQWLLVALCFLIVMADGMDVAIMGFVAPPILQEWGISKAAFGLVMSAAPVGLVIGALVAGPSSDRWGRKGVLLASVLLFGVFTILTAHASSPTEMAVLRLLTGIGLGAAMPNSTTLLSEYAPARKRALLITVMFTGFNLGSALIGFVAAWLIPVQGWRSVLVFGGVLPLVILPLLAWLLPESARLLAAQGKPAARIASVLGRVAGQRFTGEERFVSSEPPLPTRKPIGILFANGFALLTASLWITYFMGLLVIYLLTGWLPTLMKEAGLSIATAANVTALFQLGGTIGAVLVGWAMDKVKRPVWVIAAAYLAGGLCAAVLGGAGALSPALAVIVFSTGFCMSGAQTGLNAFAPACYPTIARATGVSWMLGMGRFGSIFGSAIGGALIGMGLGFGQVLAMLAIPAALAAFAILLSQRAAAASGEPLHAPQVRIT
ncbi:aromatic acid/H+ symport family MFS transporter [Ramlibacter sp. G-1-2-2]|uniref:Aromatic acid/H+ symport family MFS transporter n=1 Tax=Ramlibacter agri TaxID=2728837 RepID=A0A848HER3_9BURK|nr:aromatic acid/H+ symport family MFS transporter [Ramlibacter agri]NML47023.1 aromatic acid/H+ symport family MFS transporter [Ramlibacter agri]